MKSKGNLGDTHDTTINVEKKCKKNVKHDPVINSKQKCKEKENEKKKITSICKGNGKSNIPAINKESSGPKTKKEALSLPSNIIWNDTLLHQNILMYNRLSRPLVALLAATSTDTWVLELDEIQEMKATNMELFIRKSLEYYEIPFKKITVLVSDDAPVCCKLGKTLTKVCEIKHIIYACHTLHLISAKLIDSFDLANLVCSKLNKIFKTGKQAVRNRILLQKNGKLISLPCLTRWGTWLQTCIEVLHNKDKLKQFIQLQSVSLLRHKLTTKFKAQKKSQIKAQNSNSSKNKL
ncbi:hypothetical protein M0812_03390 [Anaeramoeba flamelloides]|uniref:DUF659 domain-containing protein n=1 Tax=Anaeramoeba flamelloides TaxID=1746091 RepID=A0AAV8ADH0_9EUKA|nr:hypothetical protein M0812_03390 [Anaeramoeba flamelloides]